ncbi:DUF6174 domain-containing protein [Streptomyces collinus]|uniref:DUF6174 domain-containing protein n=1 Tax=Streptomyces collinus TaxID=42684 RepID=UPI002943D175|nr:DUF6174 domain-containing protein [Streptomyces collinus]
MRPARSAHRFPPPRLVLVAALVWAAAACQGQARSSPAEQAGSIAWTEPSAYTYTLTSTGGERLLIGTFRVTVRDRKAVRVVGLDEQGRAVVRRAPDAVPTLGGLLRELAEARRGGADTAEVRYSSAGHPLRISLDWSADAVDDEARYVISDYAVTDAR